MKRVYRNSSSRRLFLKQTGAALVGSLPLTGGVASALMGKLNSVGEEPSSRLLKNRAPLTPNAFYVLPLGAVKPAGWLLDQLKIQATGLGGHLDETWADVGSNSGWLGGSGESWERGPYFLDGLIPLAYLLDDAGLKAKAKKFVDWTLTNQRPNGMIGPRSNDDWWPRMVMLKALAQYQEATGDPRVIPALSRYFAYQLSTLPTRPLVDWGKFRWQDNVLIVIWLYNRTGDPKLLELAELLHKQGFDWQANFADFKYTQPITREFIRLDENQGHSDLSLATHGVNNGQAVKASPVWSVVSGKEEDRRAVHQLLNALDTYHGLPNGMFSCDEHFAGRNPSQGTELCTVVETMFSLEQSLAILGDAPLGDRLELIAFNALPGTFTDDMWAHQYNQEPNQVECSLHHKPWTTDGPESNLYGLEPHFGCCAANFHQGWPKFAASVWMASDDDGLVAACYSPCEVNTTVGRTDVHLSEVTEYPFREVVRITVNPKEPVPFPLRLRIPAWAENAVILINGKPQPSPAIGAFARIERTWKAGDIVELRLPMKPRVITGFRESVSLERGPILFSYPIGESWLKLRDRGLTADWQVYPATQWNYALETTALEADSLSVKETPIQGGSFSLIGAPIKIEVKARKLDSWHAVDGVADVVPQSPVASAASTETITLVPYAAAKLRITSFPQVNGERKT
ncbi:beta-L-arabinofuranosidase domain-containing protein [Tunturiibacter gelidoferens]|uniref:DUF1680 family protein n=1 Tax=Tunturiibacter gelidiferens TaxID=3069689 RepID=A0A9X0QHD2_9BACT|nr:beta-L-arabinofuranosidase domain-containing protein [Edaphobacter lichenicola]MBB5330304.1 DUF1680 family protein [Edaphobacter lichenicola]